MDIKVQQEMVGEEDIENDDGTENNTAEIVIKNSNNNLSYNINANIMLEAYNATKINVKVTFSAKYLPIRLK